jgi:hypothetical protein
VNLNEKQKEILQKKFANAELKSNELEGIGYEVPETLLNLAADICRCTKEMLQETEPNALYSINNLGEAAEVLSSLAAN